MHRDACRGTPQCPRAAHARVSLAPRRTPNRPACPVAVGKHPMSPLKRRIFNSLAALSAALCVGAAIVTATTLNHRMQLARLHFAGHVAKAWIGTGTLEWVQASEKARG